MVQRVSAVAVTLWLCTQLEDASVAVYSQLNLSGDQRLRAAALWWSWRDSRARLDKRLKQSLDALNSLDQDPGAFRRVIDHVSVPLAAEPPPALPLKRSGRLGPWCGAAGDAAPLDPHACDGRHASGAVWPYVAAGHGAAWQLRRARASLDGVLDRGVALGPATAQAYAFDSLGATQTRGEQLHEWLPHPAGGGWADSYDSARRKPGHRFPAAMHVGLHGVTPTPGCWKCGRTGLCHACCAAVAGKCAGIGKATVAAQSAIRRLQDAQTHDAALLADAVSRMSLVNSILSLEQRLAGCLLPLRHEVAGGGVGGCGGTAAAVDWMHIARLAAAEVGHEATLGKFTSDLSC